MSCERNSNSAGGAGIKNGITRLANKAGNTLGAIQSGYARTMDIYNDQVTRRVAPATNNILARDDRPTSTAAALTSRVATSQVFPFVVTAAVMFRPGFDTRVNKIVLVPTSRARSVGNPGLDFLIIKHTVIVLIGSVKILSDGLEEFI